MLNDENENGKKTNFKKTELKPGSSSKLINRVIRLRLHCKRQTRENQEEKFQIIKK